jgi:NAD-dependent dihydropyrimidine dehydrogenase PreA subunit
MLKILQRILPVLMFAPLTAFIQPQTQIQTTFDFENHNQLFIDPAECIDCNVCEPECPVEAIFIDDEVPEEWEHFTQLNADYFQ